MKKTLLIFLIFLTAKTYSQTISYGVSAGFTYTHLPGNGTLYYYSAGDYIPGFQVGGLLDIGFKSFSIQPGILYTTAGGKGQDYLDNPGGTGINYMGNKIVLDYIRVPLNLLYKFKAGSTSIFIGGGPYAAIGVSGKFSFFTDKNYNFTGKIRFDSDAAGAKNPDLGLNTIGGIRLKSGFALSAGYSLGLSQVYNAGTTDKNRGFNLSVSYFF